MTQIFLSYARNDGKAAATRLRSELERVDYQVWRDIEDMQGGQAWKDQLRKAIKTVEVVIVLLTPAAVVSKYVEWEWETALTVEKKVIPLLILPCDVPSDLRQLHYHNLSTEQDYTLGFASLIRDLNKVQSKNVESEPTPSEESVTTPANAGNHNISITGNVDGSSVVSGSGNIVGNNNTVNR